MRLSPLAVVLAFVSASMFLSAAGEIIVTIDVNLNDSNANVDGLFVSNSMPHKISKWESMPFRDTKFRELSKALAPSSLRVLANPEKNYFKDEDAREKQDDTDTRSKHTTRAPKDRLGDVTHSTEAGGRNRSVERKRLDHVRPDLGKSDHGKSDLGKSDHGKSDHGKSDHGKSDHGKSDHGNLDDGKLDQGNSDPGKFEQGTSDRNASEPVYSAKEKSIPDVPRTKRNSTIYADRSEAEMPFSIWEELYSFVQYVGWDISMDFTNLDRKADGTWDSAAADDFLEYAVTNNIRIPDFQLGNEPNLYPSKYNISGITPERTLRDFQDLRSKLQAISLYKNSTLVGPETTRPSSSRPFFIDFLARGGCKVVDEISFHQYYRNLDKHSPTVNDFLNTSIMDLLELQFNLAKGHMGHYGCSKSIRLSESSSISGGLPDVADRFVAGFLWLDKLGVAARSGVTRVFRFNIWGGSYSLLNKQTFDPNPDYYLTVLFKRLVEGPVFNVTTSSPDVRAYANCVRPLLYPKGPIVIYLLNVLKDPVTLYLKQFQNSTVDTYFFTPGDTTGVLARTVKVNDIMMSYNLGGNLTFKPRPAKGSSIPMPANSFGFIVVPKSSLRLCREMRPSSAVETLEKSPHQQKPKEGVAHVASKSKMANSSASSRLGFEALALSAALLLSLDILSKTHPLTSVSLD